MAKAIKKSKKKRAKNYVPKVKFEGSFEDMLKISATGAGVKKEDKINMNNIRKVYRVYKIEKTHSHFQTVYGLSLTNKEFDTYEDAERCVIESVERLKEYTIMEVIIKI